MKKRNVEVAVSRMWTVHKGELYWYDVVEIPGRISVAVIATNDPASGVGDTLSGLSKTPRAAIKAEIKSLSRHSKRCAQIIRLNDEIIAKLEAMLEPRP